jgi:hypothetical protein
VHTAVFWDIGLCACMKLPVMRRRQVCQSAVIPDCALGAAVERLPKRFAQDLIVKKYGSGIVSFAGKRAGICADFAGNLAR